MSKATFAVFILVNIADASSIVAAEHTSAHTLLLHEDPLPVLRFPIAMQGPVLEWRAAVGLSIR